MTHPCQLLLDHGADWAEANGFGGDALGSCLHAARNQPDPLGDYAAVLRLLQANGAPAPQSVDDLPDELLVEFQKKPQKKPQTGPQT